MNFKVGDIVQYRTPGVVRYSPATRYEVIEVETDGYVIIRGAGKSWRCSAWRLERAN